MDARAASCPIPPSSTTMLLALPAEDSIVSDKQAALPDGAKIIEATYRKPYMAHASIGPSCALARIQGRQDDGVDAHSQGVFPLRNASCLGSEDAGRDAVRCVHAEGSGCYGHNGADDVGLDAALLARAVPGRPVRLQWMRDDEFGWEPFGPAMIMRAKAA